MDLVRNASASRRPTIAFVISSAERMPVTAAAIFSNRHELSSPKSGEDTHMNWNEREIMGAREAILNAAQAMIAGRLTYIEGARVIWSHRERAKFDESDPDFVPFIGIISETDTLPVGKERSLWQRKAL